MKKIALLSIIFFLAGTSCQNTTLPPNQTAVQADAILASPPQPTTPTAADNKVLPNEALLGPAAHNIHLATSDNGVTWTLEGRPLIEHASVPDLTVLTQPVNDLPIGTLVGYFVDAKSFHQAGDERIGMIYSTNNGATWSQVVDVEFTGAGNTTPVDPSIIQLNDGSLRLYYFDFSNDLSSIDKKSTFYSATSTDGLKFTVDGPIYEHNGIATDPDIIYFNNKWHLFFAEPKELMPSIQMITSDSDHFFGETTTIPVSGIPGTLILENELQIYGCGDGGIVISSTKDTVTWAQQERIISVPENTAVCDPAPVQTSDGRYVALIKEQSVMPR
ncbi:MAG: hypothetical protein COW24_04245 [Candidatus Kerfeldbacteria bacterium CG15_BIG_FIL_POST_REV_8_21_14_020_45_12]|uniref:Exo-alpha-sialidase n=1 Tax=Candidatus Kerfeldbacteria bacterium CG15_BIG_FIL_POST_REV_8_21_14_020_45_12 TaxID=2014247 RepID=A0A2M7H320_9BACT|nr:MAG: hypothetical protein COW24_04245 [Candidatus Kerfeldbacteria bacterium CG15_BIG_FIL_POST_REV_8_21_14_020_45_12]PJA93314.1 MAG: hypothetical protein CO132_03740 [Candidatus Kerfeldbacteria bacterium CG_4_9_14_3_um_filter_45_8]